MNFWAVSYSAQTVDVSAEVSQLWIHQVFFLCLFPSKTVKDLEVNFLMSIEHSTTFCPTNSTVRRMKTDQPTSLLRDTVDFSFRGSNWLKKT